MQYLKRMNEVIWDEPGKMPSPSSILRQLQGSDPPELHDAPMGGGTRNVGGSMQAAAKLDPYGGIFSNRATKPLPAWMSSPQDPDTMPQGNPEYWTAYKHFTKNPDQAEEYVNSRSRSNTGKLPADPVFQAALRAAQDNLKRPRG